MTATTRLALRQEAAGRLAGLTTGAATSNVSKPVSLITDTDTLLDSGDSSFAFTGEYFMFTSGLNAGTERRISSYVATAGAIALGNPLALDVAVADAYEIHTHLSPSQWNACINSALRRCVRRREVSVTVVTSQNQYSLAALTDLTKKQQVIEVIVQRGPALLKTRRALSPITEYELWESDDALTLNLLSPETANVADNLVILVAYLAPYAALSSDAATTTCDLDWAVTGTLLQAMERYKHRVEEPAKQNLAMTASDFKKEFRNLSLRFAPQRAVTIGARFV